MTGCSRTVLPLLVLAAAAHPQSGFQNRSAIDASDASNPIDLERHRTVVAKTLMITDPGVLNDPQLTFDPARASQGDQNGLWNLGRMLTRAIATMSPAGFEVQNSPSQLLLAWRRQLDADPILPGKRVLMETWAGGPLMPFRLLAISNRPDLGRVSCPDAERAVVENGKVCGAEVRFVFGLYGSGGAVVNSEAHFLAIVEFVLPAMSKQEFRVWTVRSIRLAGSANYREDLLSLTEYAQVQARSIRLRLNVRSVASTEGLWTLREYHITRDGIRRTALRREIHSDKIYVDGAKNNRELVKYVMDEANAIAEARHELTPGLVTMHARTTNGTALTLSPSITSDRTTLEGLRHVLSVNTCTGCHGSETATNFRHISMRAHSEPAALSRFLTGAGAGALPSNTVPSPGFVPPIRTDFGTGAGSYSYNDLLRRHKFLIAATIQDPNAADEVWRRALEPFTAVEVH